MINKREYYISYSDNFTNMYNLYYTTNEDMKKYLPENSIKITRKEAIRYAIEERKRRKENPNFSGYADIFIWPADANRDCIYRYTSKNYILELDK